MNCVFSFGGLRASCSVRRRRRRRRSLAALARCGEMWPEQHIGQLSGHKATSENSFLRVAGQDLAVGVRARAGQRERERESN